MGFNIYIDYCYALAMHGISPVDGRVYEVRYGKQYSRENTPQPNPKTELQEYVRGVFARSVEFWQGLPWLFKEYYRRKARDRCMTGFNLFISEYMTAELDL